MNISQIGALIMTILVFVFAGWIGIWVWEHVIEDIFKQHDDAQKEHDNEL